MANRGHRALIEAPAKPSQYGHVAYRAVEAHDDFEQHVPGDTAPARLVRIVGFDFPEESRGLDTTARSVGSAARTATGAVTNSRTNPLTVPGALSGSGASVTP